MRDVEIEFQEYFITSLQEYVNYTVKYLKNCEKYPYPTKDIKFLLQTLKTVYEAFYNSLDDLKTEIYPEGHPSYFATLNKCLRIGFALRELHPFLQYLEVSKEEIVRPELYFLISEHFRIIGLPQVKFMITIHPRSNFSYIELILNLKNKIRWISPNVYPHVPFPIEFFAILNLPITEINNSLSWSSLIHEISHAIDEKEGLSSQITIVRGLDPLLENWLGEISADVIAARFLGPAYLKGMVRAFLSEFDPRKGFKTHPPSKYRIEIIKEEVENMGFKVNEEDIEGRLILKIWKNKLTAHETNPYQSAYGPILEEALDDGRTEDILGFLNNIKSALQNTIRSSIKRHFNRKKFKNAKLLTKRLEEKILISSLQDKTSSDYKEVPSDITEIINAMWIYYEQSYHKETSNIEKELIKKGLSKDEILKQLRDRREKLDNLILKSIELSNIHRKYLESKVVEHYDA